MSTSEQPNKAAVAHSSASKEQTVDVTAPRPSTEESTRAYIERTVATSGEQVDSPAVTFLPFNPVEGSPSHVVGVSSRVSESGDMAKVVVPLDAPTQELADEDRQDDLVIKVSSGIPKTDYFQTDTSHVGDLYDRAMSKCQSIRQPSLFLDQKVAPIQKLSLYPSQGLRRSRPLIIVLSVPPKQLSASRSALIRRNSTEKTPNKLPMGHPTVAFNKQQVH